MAEKCPYCDWRIQKTEEFVNCPSCGTKHHASCWERAKKCYKCGLITKEDYKKYEEEPITQKPEEVKDYISDAVNFAKENINNTLNNEETGMFANVGEKLKRWAKGSFIIGVTFTIITVIAMLAVDEELFLVALGAGVVEMVASYASALIFYAFAEMVDNSTKSKEIQQQILYELRNKKEQ